jgi:4,5-dihydroxyphthalate decarboxylase
MQQRPLTIALATYGITAALKQGLVDTGPLSLHHVEVDPINRAMRRMVRTLEFDICEMAITTYLCALDHGVPITAIPVFVTRNFHHWAAFTHGGSRVLTPRDLAGARVAINRGYTVTTGVWVRGLLADQYGVDLNSITWGPTDDEHVADYVCPTNVDRTCIGGNAAALLESGACAAAIGDIKSSSGAISPLIADARAVGLQSFRDTGIYPINHTVVVRNDVLAAHPELAAQLMAAFEASKTAHTTRLAAGVVSLPGDDLAREIEGQLNIDPFAFGVAANRPTLNAITRYAAAQKITSTTFDVDQLFAIPK